jgi:hypothetical protein
MRTSLIPSPRTPFDRLTSILVRVLSLIGIVGLLVVVLHSLPGEKGKAASVSAAPNGTATEPARTASAAPAQAATPRIVSTSPGAAPNAVPAPAQPQPVAALTRRGRGSPAEARIGDAACACGSTGGNGARPRGSACADADGQHRNQARAGPVRRRPPRRSQHGQRRGAE